MRIRPDPTAGPLRPLPPLVNAMPQSSPFDRVRTRTLIWIVPLVFALELVERSFAGTGLGRAWEMADGFGTGLVLIVLAWAWWQLRSNSVHIRRFVGAPPRDLRAWVPVLVALPLIPLAIGAMWFQLYALSFAIPELIEKFLNADIGAPTLIPGEPVRSGILVLQAVVLYPVVEEVVFRGMLLHRWRRKWGNRAAVLGTSLAFALLHADVLGSFVFGIVMVALYVRSGTLLLPIACHALYNGCLVIWEAWDLLGVDPIGAVESVPEGLAGLRGDWPFAVICLALSLPILLMFLRRGSFRTHEMSPSFE